jgi:hypothetical protein
LANIVAASFPFGAGTIGDACRPVKQADRPPGNLTGFFPLPDQGGRQPPYLKTARALLGDRASLSSGKEWLVEIFRDMMRMDMKRFFC